MICMFISERERVSRQTKKVFYLTLAVKMNENGVAQHGIYNDY